MVVCVLVSGVACHCEEERSDDVAIPIVERKAVP